MKPFEVPQRNVKIKIYLNKLQANTRPKQNVTNCVTLLNFLHQIVYSLFLLKNVWPVWLND